MLRRPRQSQQIGPNCSDFQKSFDPPKPNTELVLLRHHLNLKRPRLLVVPAQVLKVFVLEMNRVPYLQNGDHIGLVASGRRGDVVVDFHDLHSLQLQGLTDFIRDKIAFQVHSCIV